MITSLLTILVVAVVLFELFEHLLFPLVWSFVIRKRRSPCGTEGIPGKVVEVKDWRDASGRVLLEGEFWMATSDDPIRPGDKPVVQEVNGLVLKVVLVGKQTGGSNRQAPA
jgi:membrane-bound ClpP family serine protease